MQSEEKKMKGKEVPKEEVELEESFEVKYASTKKGPIKVTKFSNVEDAKEFLQTVRAAGMNGIISKGGKPIKESHIPYYGEEELDEGLPPHLQKLLDKKGNIDPSKVKKHVKVKGRTKVTDVTPKGYGPKEEFELDEARKSKAHPLEGHPYHSKTNAQLEYIGKDAHQAAKAMRNHDPKAEAKYLDQANDAATVRYWRKRNGTPDWYKEKYKLKEEISLSEKKKKKSYLETDMKKRKANNDKAQAELRKGPQMRNPAFEEVEIDEASKVPAGMKFIASYIYKDATGKEHTHKHLRKGTKMTDPVVVYIDGKEWKEFPKFTTAKQSAINHIKGMKGPSKFAKEEVEQIDEAGKYNSGEFDLSKNNDRKLLRMHSKMKDSKMSDKDRAVFAALRKELIRRNKLKEEVELDEAIKPPSKPAFKKQNIDDLPSWREREGKPAYEPAPKNKRYAKSPKIKWNDPPTKGELARAAAEKKRKMKEEVEQIDEKSVSQNQQKLMGMALAYKRGELDNASDEVKKLASSMTEKQLKDFAKTKHAGLPVKKEEAMKTLKDFLEEKKLSKKQKKHMDTDKDGDIDATDLANLRKEDTEQVDEEKYGDTGWVKKSGPRKDKYGNVIKDKNVAKHLAKKGMAQTKEEVEQVDERKQTPGTGFSSDPLQARIGLSRTMKSKYTSDDDKKLAKSQLRTAIKSTLKNKEHRKPNLPEEIEQFDETEDYGFKIRRYEMIKKAAKRVQSKARKASKADYKKADKKGLADLKSDD